MESHTWEMFLILMMLFIEGKADFTCFSSNSSEAKHITLIYDKHHDTRNIWEQNPPALVPCDFSSIFSSIFSSKCSVCLNDLARPETVLLVLWNLTGSEELRMEGRKGKLIFQPIDCPRPEPIRGNIGLYIFLSCFIAVIFLIIIIIIIIWLAQKRHKSQQTPADGSSTNSSGPEISSELINTPRNGS